MKKNGATNIVYKKSGGVLYIADKSGKTRFRFTGNARISGCDLEIVFPSDYTLNALSISTVTGSIRLEEVRLHSADFASVNSDIRIFGYAEDIRINTVNGDAEIKSQGGLKRLAVQTVNSDIRLFVPQGEKVRVHDTARSARVEFWNKDVKAAADEEAAEVSISSVHADVIVGKL